MKFSGIACATLAVGFSVSTALAQAQCSGFSSVAGDFPTTLTFSNQAESPEDSFIIYWMDFEGNAVKYAQIFPGDGYGVTTNIYHPWIVTAPLPGGGEICVGSYMPDPGGRHIVLE